LHPTRDIAASCPNFFPPPIACFPSRNNYQPKCSGVVLTALFFFASNVATTTVSAPACPFLLPLERLFARTLGLLRAGSLAKAVDPSNGRSTYKGIPFRRQRTNPSIRNPPDNNFYHRILSNWGITLCPFLAPARGHRSYISSSTRHSDAALPVSASETLVCAAMPFVLPMLTPFPQLFFVLRQTTSQLLPPPPTIFVTRSSLFIVGV